MDTMSIRAAPTLSRNSCLGLPRIQVYLHAVGLRGSYYVLLRANQELDLSRHSFGERFVKRTDRTQVPVERRDRISGFEQIETCRIPLFFILSERLVGSRIDGGGQQLRIAQSVGDAMCSQRVLEISGIADQWTYGKRTRVLMSGK